ncbi:MAG: inorganic phosphate transporter, partial [Bacteroidales bacterium]|nr:inorganic phosphate transporter [Bacteroidales bacterium]
MNFLFLCIVVILIGLAAFDLVVGVSNDAVNFLSSAIGAKVAKFRTIAAVAAVGVFIGAAMSNGMMDVARHGIMTPAYFSFYDVMCVFLAVMLTDIVLLDVFNTLGMPTSTTVSMVFELLGGSFAIALLGIIRGKTGADGSVLTLGNFLNTEKAMSVIFGIFLSVAIAFAVGLIVQWVARLFFSFAEKGRGGHIKKGVFAGVAITVIIWFMLIVGLKGSRLMSPEFAAAVNGHGWLIVGGGVVAFSVIMTLLSALRVPVLKFVVLLGTMALAMAFASNDLVNFVGVPLTGLEAFQDYVANGGGNSEAFMMTSLMGNAQTPWMYLIGAGAIMVAALVFSKKARNVVKTSVDLSRQDEGDEMFGSSAAARSIVRFTRKVAGVVVACVPGPVAKWVDSRFDARNSSVPEGAAFDEVRAVVNLVLASLLVVLGTSLKLPLSTTYVTFMVAMGSSLADRAWSRESAVFRVTGMLSVIGGWFITAGAAFITSYLVANILDFGGFVAMFIAAGLAVFLVVRSNFVVKKSVSAEDGQFQKLMRSRDEEENWLILNEYVRMMWARQLAFFEESYEMTVSGLFHEEYRRLKRAAADMEEERKMLKRERRRGMLGLRRINQIQAAERNASYFTTSNALSQMLHSLERIIEACREHVGNNFSP